MKIIMDLVRRASVCCRRDRSLNKKRMHPSVAEDQNQTAENQDTVLETMEADILSKHLPPLTESHTFVVITEENQPNGDCQSNNDTGANTLGEPKVEGLKDEHTSEGCNLHVCEKKHHSDGEATSAGDAAVFSSEDSENDDHDLDGENPQKKRKLNTDGIREEDRITQEWDNDMKLIKRNLGRISRLFEVYDGYRDKKNPLTINSDLIIHESVGNGQEHGTENNNALELAKLQASLVTLPSPTKILGRQQLMGSVKQVMEVIVDENGDTSTKASASYDQVIDVSKM